MFQLWQAGFSVTHPEQGGGVAFAAHVGGFVFGVLAIQVFQVRPPLRPRRGERSRSTSSGRSTSCRRSSRRALENVAVVVEEEAPGRPRPLRALGVRRVHAGQDHDLPAPADEAFPDPEELEEEIRITVLHELAHYFGIDEDRLDELGYS